MTFYEVDIWVDNLVGHSDGRENLIKTLNVLKVLAFEGKVTHTKDCPSCELQPDSKSVDALYHKIELKSEVFLENFSCQEWVWYVDDKKSDLFTAHQIISTNDLITMYPSDF